MANNYHQLSLKDTFQTARTCLWMMFLPFFNFWSSILIFLFLFHKLFITLFISILVAKESIRLLVSFLPLSYKNLSYPHGFPADTIIESLQGTSGFLRFFQSP